MSAQNWSANNAGGNRGLPSSAQPGEKEMEQYLSQLFDEGVGNNLEEMTYKPANSGNTKAGSGANKGSATMGNGKDFFIELRKQFTSLAEKEKAGG